MSPVSRRTLAKGAAWSVPAVSLAAAAPALAASSEACPPGIVATATSEVEAWFAVYKAALPDMTGIKWAVAHMATINKNGALHNPGTLFSNIGEREVDLEAHPFIWEVGVMNVGLGDGVAIDTYYPPYPKNTDPSTDSTNVRQTWHPQGVAVGSPTAEAGREPKQVYTCTGNQRDFNMSSSYGHLVNPETFKNLGRSAVTEEEGACVTDSSGRGYLSYQFAHTSTSSNRPGRVVNLFAYQLRDGSYDGGTIYVSQGIRPRGFQPMTWEAVMTAAKASHPELSDEQVNNCYRAAYDARVSRWFSTPDDFLRNAEIYATGLRNYHDLTVTTGIGSGRREIFTYSGHDERDYTPITTSEMIWSHEWGNHMAAQTSSTITPQPGAPNLDDYLWRRYRDGIM
ncbi:hypothetical protein [Actinomyces faecalis]|uniref:hypothetical protein n=1 Tax=Actinomyces faecalis TaxID=2722820 RepID=UPI0015567063|nr:hypothetical protein [Actinomyces faecalis]